MRGREGYSELRLFSVVRLTTILYECFFDRLIGLQWHLFKRGALVVFYLGEERRKPGKIPGAHDAVTMWHLGGWPGVIQAAQPRGRWIMD